MHICKSQELVRDCSQRQFINQVLPSSLLIISNVSYYISQLVGSHDIVSASIIVVCRCLLIIHRLDMVSCLQGNLNSNENELVCIFVADFFSSVILS